MDTKQSLLEDIAGYLERTGMAKTTFGRLAVNDGKFVDRLRAGGGVTTTTMDRVRAFIGDAPMTTDQAATEM